MKAEYIVLYSCKIIFILVNLNFVETMDMLRGQFIADFINLINDKTKYDKNYFAPTKNGAPILVNVSMVIHDLRDVTEVKMSFRSDIYLTQIWNDPRYYLNEIYKNLSYTVIQSDTVLQMWHPDTYFPNVLESTSADPADESFTHKTILKVNGIGDVYYCQRLSLTSNCRMNLIRFPFDFQLCKLSLRSFGLTNKNLDYKWDTVEPVVFANTLSLPDLIMFNYSTAEYRRNLSNQIFNGLNMCFMFERKTNFYFTELYIPATMLIFVAWLSSMTEYRFTNLLSVLLAQLFLYFSYIAVMPKVSDIKAMDIFLVTCFIFIFAALIKTFFVKDKKPTDIQAELTEIEIVKPFSIESGKGENNFQSFPEIRKSRWKKLRALFSWTGHHYCQGLNGFLFTCYPAFFALFSLIYFFVYMYVLHDQSLMDRCDTF